MSLWFDAALRGPIIGSFLMCVCAAVAGVLVFLRKQTLIGETLSHATYPGIVLGGFVCAFFDGMFSPLIILGGAFLFSLFGYYLLRILEEKGGVDPDNALCFILAFSLGVGVLLASQLQAESPLWYRRVQSYLYGQAVTLTDVHIYIYAILTSALFTFVIVRFREIELASFDRVFAQTIGVQIRAVDAALMVLLSISIVIGIRCVGVILMSGMLIAPAIVARQLSRSFSTMIYIAACVGGCSAALGTIVAFHFSTLLSSGAKSSLPPGPVILLIASVWSVVAVLLAPSRGLFFRFYRSVTFHFQCQSENLLKSIWKEAGSGVATLKIVVSHQALPKLVLKVLFWKLNRDGWILIDGLGGVSLTGDGKRKAEHIVRLHRLWEVYLVNYLGVSAKRVHRSAEEIEHILTPELERELLGFVGTSTHDPHKSPIPGQGGVL